MIAQSRYLTDFDVAGMRYWDGALVLGELKPGERLTLVAEPDNPYDADAVAICRDDVKLGYVPSGLNALPAQLLRFGHGSVIECRILKVNPRSDTWRQVRVGLYLTDASVGERDKA